jgi:type I restriction enzyme S subunit
MKQNWIYKKLDEVCDINYGTRVVHKKDKGSTYYVFGGGGATFLVDTYNREDCFIVSRFAMSQKCTRFVKGKFFLNDSGLSVSPKTIDLTQPFLDKVLLANNDTIYSFGKGMAQRNLDIPSFKKLIIPIPPLETQSHIVSELDLLQSIIDKQKAQLKELDNLAQSIFYDMFGDPVENEKGWKTIAWKDLFDTILGKMLDVKKQNSNDERRCYLGNTNVQWCSFELNNLKTMTFSNKEIEKFSLKKGDILICEGGESGRCAVWEKENSDILFQKAIHRARVKSPDTIEPHYIPFLMKKIRENNGLKNYVSQATIEHLTGEKLKQLSIIVPPFSLQQSFATKIEAIEKQKAAISKSIEETQKLFDYTIDKYFG